MTAENDATTMRLFDDGARTLVGRSDKLHESEYSYLNRSARPEAAQARDMFAAFAAGFAQNRYDPGLPPGATRGRCSAAL